MLLSPRVPTKLPALPPPLPPLPTAREATVGSLSVCLVSPSLRSKVCVKERTVRVAALQGLQVVVVIQGCRLLPESTGWWSVGAFHTGAKFGAVVPCEER